MIRYALRCKEGHDFDGWFRSSEGFETLRKAGQVTCTICGTASVEKALMAPAVPTERRPTQPDSRPTEPGKGELTISRNDRERALNQLRSHIEANSDYVGLRFADEARAMHEGRSENRAIHGEAKPDEARKLIEDGVPIAPLPFLPKQKAN